MEIEVRLLKLVRRLVLKLTRCNWLTADEGGTDLVVLLSEQLMEPVKHIVVQPGLSFSPKPKEEVVLHRLETPATPARPPLLLWALKGQGELWSRSARQGDV